MELRFLERRLSESPRVYRAGAKSSIGVWARQVCAHSRNRSMELRYDSLVTMAPSRGKAFLRSASKLNNILLVPCFMLNLDDAGTIFYTAALEVAKKIRREPVTAPGLSPI
jgi:hypothetical protein